MGDGGSAAAEMASAEGLGNGAFAVMNSAISSSLPHGDRGKSVSEGHCRDKEALAVVDMHE